MSDPARGRLSPPGRGRGPPLITRAGRSSLSFDLIVPEIHRLRRLVIDARFFSSVLLVYMMLHLQYAPRLEHFSMSLSDPFGLEESWREPENTFLDILAGGAPMLSSFHLWGISLHYCHPPLRFLKRLFLTTPFDSETSLPISNVKLRNILGLRGCISKISNLDRYIVCRRIGGRTT